MKGASSTTKGIIYRAIRWLVCVLLIALAGLDLFTVFSTIPNFQRLFFDDILESTRPLPSVTQMVLAWRYVFVGFALAYAAAGIYSVIRPSSRVGFRVALASLAIGVIQIAFVDAALIAAMTGIGGIRSIPTTYYYPQ